MIVLYFISADPSLGKVDKTSLSDQTLMELFIEGVTNTGEIWESGDDSADISEWKGLTFDSNGTIKTIEWEHFGNYFELNLTGSLQLQWLPSTLVRVAVSGHQLSGSIDLEHLPEALLTLGGMIRINLPHASPKHDPGADVVQ
uniref:Uncharacterized protein n=1 Tax=Paramoeba aestuarina TaxID=180227 RepID=A0A7S4PIR2_9EUKA